MTRLLIAMLIIIAATLANAQQLRVEERVGELRFALSGAAAGAKVRVIVSDGQTTRALALKTAVADRDTTWAATGLGLAPRTASVWLEIDGVRRLTHEGVSTVDPISLIAPDPARVIAAARATLGAQADAWLLGLRRVAIALYNEQMTQAAQETLRRAEAERQRIEAQKLDAALVGD